MSYDDTLAAGLIAWLERACRAADLPQDQLRAWLSTAVAHLRAARGIPVATLVDWQNVLAALLRQRIAAARTAARAEARQTALFAPDTAPAIDLSAHVRFDASTYADVALVPLGAARFAKHLLGNDAASAFDGEEGGEEFACAQSLDGLSEVEVWVRNILAGRRAIQDEHRLATLPQTWTCAGRWSAGWITTRRTLRRKTVGMAAPYQKSIVAMESDVSLDLSMWVVRQFSASASRALPRARQIGVRDLPVAWTSASVRPVVAIRATRAGPVGRGNSAPISGPDQRPGSAARISGGGISRGRTSAA